MTRAAAMLEDLEAVDPLRTAGPDPHLAATITTAHTAAAADVAAIAAAVVEARDRFYLLVGQLEEAEAREAAHAAWLRAHGLPTGSEADT